MLTLIPTVRKTKCYISGNNGRAGRPKFELQPLNGHSSAQIAATKLRIELPESSLRARGREIGFGAYFLIVLFILFFDMLGTLFLEPPRFQK